VWLVLTAAALAGGGGLALSAYVARPALVRRLLSFAASAAAVVLMIAAAAQRAPAVVQAFAAASFGLTVLALAIDVWRCSRGSGGDDTGGDDGGGGGNGRWPPRPHDPEPEPDWWPAFERQFRAYAARAGGDSAERRSPTQRARAGGLNSSGPSSRRGANSVVRVTLTPKGTDKLDALAETHLQELAQLAPTMRTLWQAPVGPCLSRRLRRR
jgi:hypothetical protein